MEIILGRSANYAKIILDTSGLKSLAISSNVRSLCLCNTKKWNTISYESKSQNRLLSMEIYSPQFKPRIFLKQSQNVFSLCNEEWIRKYSNHVSQNEPNNPVDSNPPKKLSIFQKMKQLTRDYWHILIPVHVATSIVWVAIFYMAAKNGVDVIRLMEYVHMPEKYIDIIRNSNAGLWAVTYALYKIFTPFRYTVTVGGTTMAIKYLDKMGYPKFKQPFKIPLISKPNIDNKKKTVEFNNSSACLEQKRKGDN